MYKALTIVLIAIVGIACGSMQKRGDTYNIRRPQPTVGVDFCPTCVNVADESINILLNLILNAGIVGSCETLCAALEQKTDPLVGFFCDVACIFVGIDEFIKLIENADLDPIWYCEMARACPIKDDGDCNVTQFSVLPATGRRGQTFVFDATYVTVNGTGTGEIVVEIHTPDHIPLGAGFLWEEKKPGTYSERISVKAEPDPSCDPTQEPCEQWIPGVYNVTLFLCNGECGSKHPHSRIYSTQHGSFTLTE